MIEKNGRPASSGLAEGPVFTLQNLKVATRRALSPEAETERFTAAVRTAAQDLEQIAEAADKDAAAILEFQIAMLEDEALTEPVLAAIVEGATAEAAWSRTIGAEIAGYEAAEDDYFRARAADLTDIADRVLAALGGDKEREPPPGAILIGRDITPSRFLATQWESGGGIATEAGSPSSHVAMLARARGVAMVVGLGPLDITGHDRAAIDGVAGTLILSPDAKMVTRLNIQKAEAATTAKDEARARQDPARTACGTKIEVAVNISGPDDLNGLDPAFTDGVGLMRTEFLFKNVSQMNDEARQLAAYQEIVRWAKGAPVTIRTVDAGGDKPIPGYTAAGETDPFLGLRGLRLSLTRPDIFRLQLRAIARATAAGPVRIMLPMVTSPCEILAARAHLDAALAELAAAKIDHGAPQLGMMVEVPAAALTLEDFPVDFASIGSNDLVQYLTASARDSADVAGLCDPGHRAVQIAIHAAVLGAGEGGFPISICGDAAGDPAHLPMLLGAGLRSISVAIPALGRAKLAIGGLEIGDPPP